MYILVFVGVYCCWWRGTARVGVSCVTRLVHSKCVVMHAWRCAGGRQRGRACSAALQPAYERREHVG